MRISDWSSDVCSSDLGTTGQVLRKTSSVDNDTAWGNPAAAPVDSVFGRTGAVVAASGDYNAGQISETTGAKIMTSAERSKLAGIAVGAEVNPPRSEDTRLNSSH